MALILQQRVWRSMSILLLAGFALTAWHDEWLRAQDTPAAKPEASATADKKREIDPAARTVDVEFADDGQMRMVMEIEKLEIDSPYGKMSIPVEEIVGIDFATRLAERTSQEIDKAIFDLGSPDQGLREAALKKLESLKEKAYPALVRATKHADLEVAKAANELAQKLRTVIPADQQQVRELDIIETVHSVVAGKITGGTIMVNTAQFGKQQLQLTDVRSLRSVGVGGVEETQPVDVLDDPGSLSAYSGAIGKTLAFRVAGRPGGSLWGTGVYTTDSNLAAAAVHSGALAAGETGIVRVTIIAAPPAFAGSVQNGVSSNPYGSYPSAYQVHVKKDDAGVGRRGLRGRGGGGRGGVRGGGEATPVPPPATPVPPGGGFRPRLEFGGGVAAPEGIFILPAEVPPPPPAPRLLLPE